MSSIELNDLSDLLLEIIRAQPSHPFSIPSLRRELGCNNDLIQSSIKLLVDSGYQIDTSRSKTCRFVSAPDKLLENEIKYKLNTKYIGQTVSAYQTVQSTNKVAARLAQSLANKKQLIEGAIVVAESQTRGRGRMGRDWMSLPELGIYLSLIICPEIDPAEAPGLSLLAALSLADTFSAYKAPKVNIKWPNDCLLRGRKVAGILTELTAEIGKIHYVIIGVGININHRRNDFPSGLSRTATSLRAELGTKTARIPFLQSFLMNFETDYDCFKRSGLKSLRKRILGYSNLIDRRIELDLRGDRVIGVVVDIDDSGRLILETDQGRCAFNAGEVTIIKSKQ